MLAVGVVLALATGLTVAAVTNAQGQVVGETKALLNALSLGRVIDKNLEVTNVQLEVIGEDLLLKKKFYQFEPTFADHEFIFVVFPFSCEFNDPSACAFTVESFQLDSSDCEDDAPSGNPTVCGITGLFVDGVFTDISGNGIVAPTNFMLESGLQSAGVAEFFAVATDNFYIGNYEVTGEKPQGMVLFTFTIPSTPDESCSPGSDESTIVQCIQGMIGCIKDNSGNVAVCK